MTEPQRRWHMASQRVPEEAPPQREEKRREVQAKAETSRGERKERMLSWTSSGKSEKVGGDAIVGGARVRVRVRIWRGREMGCASPKRRRRWRRWGLEEA